MNPFMTCYVVLLCDCYLHMMMSIVQDLIFILEEMEDWFLWSYLYSAFEHRDDWSGRPKRRLWSSKAGQNLMAQNPMRQVPTFWVVCLRHTEHAAMGDTRGNPASPGSWEGWALCLVQVLGSHGSPEGHNPSTGRTSVSALQCCNLCWQTPLAPRAGQEALGPCRPFCRDTALPSSGCCPPTAPGAPSAEQGCTDQLHLGQAGRVIPAGEGGCGRPEHGTRSLRGECAAPECCWLPACLPGAVCCEELLCWHHSVLSCCLFGVLLLWDAEPGWREPWSHLGPAAKTPVRDGGFVTVPRLCTGQGSGAFLLHWQQLQVGPGVVCMSAVILFHYLTELRMDTTPSISFSFFLLKEAKCKNLTLVL